MSRVEEAKLHPLWPHFLRWMVGNPQVEEVSILLPTPKGEMGVDHASLFLFDCFKAGQETAQSAFRTNLDVVLSAIKADLESISRGMYNKENPVTGHRTYCDDCGKLTYRMVQVGVSSARFLCEECDPNEGGVLS